MLDIVFWIKTTWNNYYETVAAVGAKSLTVNSPLLWKKCSKLNWMSCTNPFFIVFSLHLFARAFQPRLIYSSQSSCQSGATFIPTPSISIHHLIVTLPSVHTPWNWPLFCLSADLELVFWTPAEKAVCIRASGLLWSARWIHGFISMWAKRQWDRSILFSEREYTGNVLNREICSYFTPVCGKVRQDWQN